MKFTRTRKKNPKDKNHQDKIQKNKKRENNNRNCFTRNYQKFTLPSKLQCNLAIAHPLLT